MTDVTRAAIIQARNRLSTYWSIWAGMTIPERVVLSARIEIGRDWLAAQGRTASEIEQGQRRLGELEAQYAALVAEPSEREARLYKAWRVAEANYRAHDQQYKDLVREAGGEPSGADTGGRPSWAARREAGNRRNRGSGDGREAIVLDADGPDS